MPVQQDYRSSGTAVTHTHGHRADINEIETEAFEHPADGTSAAACDRTLSTTTHGAGRKPRR